MSQKEVDIHAATRSYEGWMRRCGPVIESHLQHKHEKMRQDPFQFFRGSYYRWAQIWFEVCAECANAPRVLSVGDLHVDSFGTWRDTEGRLCWGVDDFDEAFPLPYTNDLVRLAASVKVARSLGLLNIKTKDACEIVLDAYIQTLRNGGCPLVLAESETALEKLGIEALKTPKDFWRKLNEHPSVGRSLPDGVRQCLARALPAKDLAFRIVRREAGLGSLGQQRFVAIAYCSGGYIAREAKRVVPSASVWLTGRTGNHQPHYEDAIRTAVRSPDPFQKVRNGWLIRRLSPDSNPISMEELSCMRDETILLHAMGNEVANVHLGKKRQPDILLKDLKKRKAKWLPEAGRRMARQITTDWKQYRA
ncbi:DUF2252 domain-containing protein [Terriglobus albidus]|uniref:DUF2252 domain-containing protein n=1 Tax=Terriglobus albidus TaxID=1592106 RepID=UPI0021E0E978|nr:DUF2252 domain-containing protein [Terriglobus albidus]